MALAAEEYADLIESMGLAGTAAANLEGILGRLAGTQKAVSAVEKIAAETGSTAAQVRAALAAANKEAADTEARLAAEQQRAAAAAERAAAAAARETAAKEAAAERAAVAAEKAAAREQAAKDTAAAREQAATDRAVAAAERAAERQAAATERAAERAAETAMRAAERQAAAQERASEKAARDAEKLAEKQAKEAEVAAAQQAKAADAAAKPQREFGDAMIKSSEAGTQLGGVLGKVQDALAGMGPKGQAAAAAIGVLVITITAAVAAITGLIGKAIEATQAKDALRDMVGEDTLDMLEEMADRLPYTTDQLGEWAKKLKIAGYEGDRLMTAIEAVAASAARMKDGGRAAEGLLTRLQLMADAGQKIKLDRRFLSQLAEAGLGVQDLADAMGVPIEKLKTMQITADQAGEAIQRALIEKGNSALTLFSQSWASIKAKIGEGIEDAFEDLGDLVGPFMTEVQALASEFYKGGLGARILAVIVREVLEPAFRIATAAVRWLHMAALQMTIAALKVYIALKPTIAAVQEWAANSKTLQLVLDNLVPILKLVGALILAFWAPIGGVVVAFALMAAAIIAVIGALISLADAIGTFIGDTLGELDAWIEGGNTAGSNFVRSIVTGIKSGAAYLAEAVGDLAKTALDSFRNPLQMKSPSRVLVKHGRDDMAGAVATGVDKGADDVERAMTRIAAPPKGGKGGGRGGRWAKLADKIEIIFQGSARDFPSFRDQMEQWLDEQAASGPEPEGA